MPAAWAQSAPVTTPSGLIYQSLKEGSGASPAASDTVKVHYLSSCNRLFPPSREAGGL
jgi:FKBP-type peptidyl-prolyl cis-trans isomerase FkpA